MPFVSLTFAWVFSSSSSSSSVIPTAAFARNIYVMSRIMHGFRGDCDSVCAIKCDKYYCFCFTVQMKKGRKKQTKRKINEMSLQWTWSLFDRQRMQNAKKVDWMQRFFSRLFLLSIFYMATCRAYYSHINVLEAQESADNAKEIDYSFVSFLLLLTPFGCLALFSRKLHSITTQRMECAPRKFA